MVDSAQKFIGRNRAPRVQIEYDVELYGAEKKVQLPFVMGVMSDLAGKSKAPQPSIADRKFLEIDVDSFDSRMKAMAPRAAFTVPNTLTGEGNIAIDLTFESLKDFSPGAIASRVDSLRPLLEARTQLQNLMAYMDGKTGAEELIEKILHTPALLSTLAQGAAASDADQASALDSLRGQALAEVAEEDPSSDVLAALSASAPTPKVLDDGVSDALASLSANAPAETVGPEAATDSALAALASAASQEAAPGHDGEAALAALRDLEPVAEEGPDETANALEDLARFGDALQDQERPSNEAILQDLAETAAPEISESDQVADILSGLETADPDPVEKEDDLTEVLGSLEQAPPPEQAAEEDGSDEVLTDLAALEVAPAPEEEDLAAVLGDLAAAAPEDESGEDSDLAEILGSLEVAEPEPSAEVEEALADVLASVPQSPTADGEQDALADILGGLDLDDAAEQTPEDADLQDLLGEMSTSPQDASDDAVALDDVLAGLEPTAEQTQTDGGNDLDDVLSGLAADVPVEDATDTSDELSLEGLLSDLDQGGDSSADAADVDSILADLESDADHGDRAEGVEASLTELLGGADSSEEDLDASLGASETGPSASEDALDLDDILGDLSAGPDDSPGGVEPNENDALDDLLANLDGDDMGSELADGAGGLGLQDDLSDLDDLLGDLETDAPLVDTAEIPQQSQTETLAGLAEPVFAYGTISAARPELIRKRFRIALFGDFSGRASRGQIEIGEALARRPAILLDPDTLEEVIEGFASELILPIGREDGGISVKLKEFDDLHPDELFENVALFSELVGLRDQLQSGVTVDHASRTLAAWAEKHGTPVRAPKRSSPSNAIPADRRLSAFQQLIGDRDNSLREASPIEEMLARVVGPYIRALPSPEVPAMQAAVDAALSDAMRLVLHHPEFQALEAQWRALDLIARSVEVDDSLEVVLYDVSAEELAADLAAQDDLTGTGLTRLLTEEPMDPDLGRGGYSALIGLYGFEETPPHAELLGRIARVAAHVDAPFFSSLSPEFLKTAKKDRPVLVGNAWDTLQQMPEAGHLGLASPRFLLRRPYGAKSNPVDAFEFEEFTEGEGLKGMLWGNPAVLVTILLGRSFKENGASMQLGSIMSLGGMPYHTVKDRFGDQVALPCTERNIDLDKIALANERGLMAVSAVKGRDELRLTSFLSVAGSEVLGPWSGVPAPAPSPADPREKTGIAPAAPTEDAPAETSDLEPDDLDLSDLGLDDLGLEDPAPGSGDAVADDGDLDDLDALLAGFSVDTPSDEDDEEEMDAELAALLADL